MKRKITLGLLVFFLGVFITACGSKGSNTTTNTTNTTTANSPVSTDNACRAQGFCQVIGDYQITNQEQYGLVFPGYNTAPTGTIQSPYDDQGWNIGGFWDSFKDTAKQCIGLTIVARIIAQLTGNGEAECEFGVSTTRNYVPTNGLATYYPTALNYEYSNSTFSRMNLSIQDGTNGGNGRVIEFYPTNSTEYAEQELYGRYNNQDLRLQWNGVGYDMDIANGQIGRLNNLR